MNIGTLFDVVRSIKAENGFKDIETSKKFVDFVKNIETVFKSMDSSPAAVNRMMLTGKVRPTKIFRNGEMVFFSYKAKPEAGEYYDRFPLVMVLEQTNEDVLGLNLHYLPKPLRLIFINAISVFLSSKTDAVTGRPRLVNFSYALLQKHRYRYGKYCIRKYKRSRMIIPPVVVPSDTWNVFAHIPLSFWIPSRTQNMVELDTISKIRKKGES
jgi:hypothetical protein